MTITRAGAVMFAATALAGMLLGGLFGAAIEARRLSDQVIECHEFRAESSQLNAESWQTSVEAHGSIVEWVCTMRGGLCR